MVALRRPPELSTETARARDFALHALRELGDFDALAIVQCTSPFTAPEDVAGAVALLESSGAESVVTVSVADAAHHPLKMKRLVGDRLLPYLEDDRLTPSHELEQLWVRNGSVYAFRRDVVERGLEADDVRGYEMPPEPVVRRRHPRGPRLRPVPRRARRPVVIPRVFHQIWLGEGPFPYAVERESWHRFHPDWEHRLWTERDLPGDLELTEAANLLRQPAERADILRLELLHRHGGVYLDADFECLKPVDPLLDGVSCFLGLLDSGRVSNAVIGTVPGHPLLAKAMAEVRPRTTYGPVDREGTGPLLLERIRHDVDGVTLFEPNVFYATEREQAEYAFHLSARSWKDEAGLRSDLARAERDRAIAREELRKLQKRYDSLERGNRLRRILRRPPLQ